MDEKSLFHHLTFSPIFWGILLGGVYIAAMWFSGGLYPLPNYRMLLLHIIFFLILRVWWYFFFAQFILPVRTYADRKKTYNRLIKKTGGAALFVQDGQLVASEGESKKSGAGVIVLDTASAVVMKKFNHYTKTAGPGVLFTDSGETIAEAPIPLQSLNAIAGPEKDENPFTDKDAQERRYATSALTRDAVEVVPNITIKFKIDADPAKGNEDGSRFGYNEDAVRKAIWHTSVNANNKNETIYWHQLPMNLAADLWREYLAKYRFDELFKTSQDVPVSDSPPPIKEPSNKEKIVPIYYEYGWRGILCELFAKLNANLVSMIEKINNRISLPLQDEEKSIETPSNTVKQILTQETALQSIQRYMAQRLKEPYYLPVDQYGEAGKGEKLESPEYKFLRERGIRVLSIGVKNLRFPEEQEKALLDSWSSTWLKNAKTEKAFIEKQTQTRKTIGKEKALIEYTLALSKELAKENPRSQPEALKTLIRSTRREIIRNPALHKTAAADIDRLTDLIQWIDKGGDPLG